MKIYALIGKSGTGKSYQAVNLCREMNIEGIIDDGLFICHNKVMAGISAKRQPTKIGAVKTALYTKDEHRQDVVRAIADAKPSSVLVIGTSDEMVDKIVERLELGSVDKRIYIEEITTEEEREIAQKQRHEKGQHIIPAPTFQLKRQFSGYFMSPWKLLQDIGPNIIDVGQNLFGMGQGDDDKSVVRPTYSYLGDYQISEKVLMDIVDCVARLGGTVYEVLKVIITQKAGLFQGEARGDEGVDVYVVVNFRYSIFESEVYGEDNKGKNRGGSSSAGGTQPGGGSQSAGGADRLTLPEAARQFQQNIAEKIEEMTAFNVNRVDLEVRDII